MDKNKFDLTKFKVSYEYSKAFKILAEAVSETNGTKVGKIEDLNSKTFEPNEKTVKSPQKDALYLKRPVWLRKPKHIYNYSLDCIIKAFQNVVYMGELKQRWELIKKFQLNTNLAF